VKAVAAPDWQGVPLWLHGDLHPANVVVGRDAIGAASTQGEIEYTTALISRATLILVVIALSP
jgi:hypothetical protein